MPAPRHLPKPTANAAAARAPVQHKSGTATTDVMAAAEHGLSGGGGTLPFSERIQHAFGRHSVSDVVAHTGGAAREANESMGSLGYATGHQVAFRGAPDLHTAAHEAAHVIQQRAGVSLKGGVGQVGDRYERHADAVADRVVQGKSAEDLLDQYASAGQNAIQQRAVQQRRRSPVQFDAPPGHTPGPLSPGPLRAPDVGAGFVVPQNPIRLRDLFEIPDSMLEPATGPAGVQVPAAATSPGTPATRAAPAPGTAPPPRAAKPYQLGVALLQTDEVRDIRDRLRSGSVSGTNLLILEIAAVGGWIAAGHSVRGLPLGSVRGIPLSADVVFSPNAEHSPEEGGVQATISIDIAGLIPGLR